MKKISKTLKVIALGIPAVIMTMGLAGCGDPVAGKTVNAVSGDFITQYLRVNDTNTVCFTDTKSSGSKSSSSNGTVCDFSNISIPNGVDVTVLTNNEPASGDWQLTHFVDLKNKTSDCVYFNSRLVSCNFLSDDANGSFGVEKEKSETGK
jgi:hypothetical protein